MRHMKNHSMVKMDEWALAYCLPQRARSETRAARAQEGDLVVQGDVSVAKCC